MAEGYNTTSTGTQQNSFVDQVFSYSNVVAVPNSYYVNPPQTGAIQSGMAAVDYLDPSGFVQPSFHGSNTIPQRSTDITDISHSMPGSSSMNLTALTENTGQPNFYNPSNAGQQQYFSGGPPERLSRGAATETMDAHTKSAFDILQGIAAEASSSYDAPRGSGDRGQFVSLLQSAQPSTQNNLLQQQNINSWSASTGTTIVLDAQDATLRPGASGVSSSAQENVPQANGGSFNPKIIKVVSHAQQPPPVTASTTKTGAGQTYKCVLVKNAGGNQILIQPASGTGTGNTVTLGQKTVAPSSGPTAAVKLSISVEQEISDMIRKTSANFTIKGDDARKSGLLQKAAANTSLDTNTNAKYLCSICTERYNQKEGFHYHLQRISFVLKYKCVKCSTVFTFFNKCALWMHINAHKENIDYQRVLRLDPYDFVSNPNVFKSDMNSSVETDSKEIMKRMMLSTQGIVKCLMCQELVRNLPLHLKRFDGKYHAHTCLVCDIHLPNKCSLQAHMRLHRGSGVALCCPECGFTWNEASSCLKDVFDHVDSCMHFNRAEAFSCECKMAFPSLAEVKKHFIDSHMKPLSKCLNCSVSFTDSKLLDAHLKRNPGCQSKGRQEAKVTCLCTLCKSVMTTVVDAKLHMNKHISNEGKLSWMCFLCSMMFPTANELRIHCEEDHPHKAKRCTICFKLFCNRKLLVDHILKKSCNTGAKHSLGRCADMPSKPIIDIDAVVKTLYRIRATQSRSQLSSPTTSSQSSDKSPAASNNVNHQAGQAEPPNPAQQSALARDRQQASKTSPDLHEISPTSATRQKSKVAVRRPVVLDNNTSELLDEMQQWMTEDGREIVPTATPPSKKRGRPKKERRPPPHLVCGVTPKGITYQCHPCKIIVTGTNNFISHMKYHEAKGDCSYSPFSHCSVCDKLISSHHITKHLKDHQDKGVIVCCRCQRRDFGNLEDAIQHAHNLCEYRKIGTDIAQAQPAGLVSGSETGTALTPSQTIATVENHPCPDSGSAVAEVHREKTPPAVQAKATLHPCHLCGLAFDNIVLRDQHVRKAHGGTRKIYQCLACEKKKVLKTFTSQVTARKHVTKKHRVVQQNLVDRHLKEVNANVANSTAPTQAPAVDEEEIVNTEGPPPKMLRLAGEGDFLCGKCGFSCPSEDKEGFSKHIATHNVKGEPQCPECGLCYTVLTAVRRHLFAVHKIKNLEDYLAKNGLVEEPEEEEDEFHSVLEEMLPGVRPLPPATRQQQASATKRGKEINDDDEGDGLECNVCYRSFDTEINLKTHMRTHGMAFIRSKRYKPI